MDRFEQEPGLGKGFLKGITKNVVVVGIVSFLTDVSSEMVYPLVPLFLASVLGAPAIAIGLIEGVAESTASILKVGSGWLSDKLRRRKFLISLGYGMSNLIKPVLAYSVSWPQVLLIRFIDRFGKGVRTSPRDALIVDVTPADARGKAFGFHRMLDTAGAMFGPLLAFFLLERFNSDFRLVFLVTAIPGILAILILIFFLRERRPRKEVHFPEISFRGLNRDFLVFALIVTFFNIGNSSDAFIILRSSNLGIDTVFIPLVFLAFNGVYTLFSLPAGVLSDRIGRKKVIVLGYLVFAFAYLGLALASKPIYGWLLFPFYGLYYALTDGVQRAYIGDLVKPSLRGTAMGTFNALIGIALLPASLIGGALWQYISPSATFYYGSVIAFIAAIALAVAG